MKHAFEKAGFVLSEFELLKLAEGYFRQPGSDLDTWIRVGRKAAAAMSGGGHSKLVQQDQGNHACARQPLTSGTDQSIHVQRDLTTTVPPARERIPGEDQLELVQQDQPARVPVGKPIPGGGQNFAVQQDQTLRAPTRNPIASGEAKIVLPARAMEAAPPAREPSAADLAAMNEAADITYFQMIKLRARAWTNYRFKDLKNVRSINMRENMVINDVIDYGRQNRINEDRFVHMSVPVKAMKEIVRRANSAIQTKELIMARPVAKRSRRHG